jgi:hypothetical protein
MLVGQLTLAAFQAFELLIDKFVIALDLASFIER